MKALSDIMFKTYTIDKWARLHSGCLDKVAGTGNQPELNRVRYNQDIMTSAGGEGYCLKTLFLMCRDKKDLKSQNDMLKPPVLITLAVEI